MGLKKVSENLIGGILDNNVISKTNSILVAKGTILTEEHIISLKENDVYTVAATLPRIEKELFFQLESFIPKSTQPFFWESYLGLVEEAKIFFHALQHNTTITPLRATDKLHETLNLLEDEIEFFKFAYSIDGYEDTLARHSANVAILCYIVEKNNPLSRNASKVAEMGFFHDIGKVYLNQEVLYKESPLSNLEKKSIKSHTFLGAKALRNIRMHSQEHQQAALLHHESYSGNGYPFGHSRNEIPFNVQIVTVCDAFDSISSDRVYKKKKPLFHAFYELYNEAVEEKLHPLIVFPFIEFFFGSLQNTRLLLSTNETGVIVNYAEGDILRPSILLGNGNVLNLKENHKVTIENFAN